MRNLLRIAGHSIFAIAVVSASPSGAQCLEWSDRFGSRGPDDWTHALAAFDDGTGPRIYAGGRFSAVGSVNADYIASSDGGGWSPLGTDKLNLWVDALIVFDDGSGPALIAGGYFTVAGSTTLNRIGKWDGSNWSALGLGMGDASVDALAVFDDGAGPALYAGGGFTTAGGLPAAHIAKWNGSSWSTLGTGINGAVGAIAVFDDGTGLALYAGGKFTNAGGVAANNVAKWNGTTWSALGTGTASANPYAGQVRALAGFGGELYAAGNFETAGGVSTARIARWNGTSWAGLTLQGLRDLSLGAIYASGDALTVLDDGSGTALYVGGHFTNAGNQATPSIARWNGTSWSSLVHGMSQEGGGNGVHTVRAIAAFDDGAPHLYAGGNFTLTAAGTHAHNLAQWDGAAWDEVATGQGLKDGIDSDIEVRALTSFDHDAMGGASLFAGGSFAQAGTSYGYGVARWDGSTWTGMPPGSLNLFGVYTLLGDADGFGAGPTLYAGGLGYSCGGLMAYRNGAWSLVGPGLTHMDGDLDPEVYALAMHDDGSGSGPSLYVGGYFDTQCSGSNSLVNIAQWNGTSFSGVGTGVNSHVRSLASFDDGSGSALYAGGYFTQAGGVPALRVARWNGTSWSAVGGGLANAVIALCVFDDGSGSGPELYAASFQVWKWNGAAWSLVGGGTNQGVQALTVFDDGTGPALIAGGVFTTAGGTSANYVAKWNGSTWSALGSGTSSYVLAVATHDDGAGGGPDLYVGGRFEQAGGVSSQYIAEWHGCQHDGEGYCFGDGLDSVVTAACPCTNFGDPGHGCANSNASLGGARLTATGTTSPNTILFRCTSVPNNTLCTFFQTSTNIAAGFVFGDGVRCVNTPLIRFGQQNSGENGNAPNTVEAAPLGAPYGFTRYYQCQYRNPAPAFCPPGTFNMSNGYRMSW